MEIDLEIIVQNHAVTFSSYKLIYMYMEGTKKYLLLLGDLLSELGGLLSDCLHSQQGTNRLRESEEKKRMDLGLERNGNGERNRI